MNSPEDADEEEGVVNEEGVARPLAKVRPGDEKEVDEEDYVERGFWARAPTCERVLGRHDVGDEHDAG